MAYRNELNAAQAQANALRQENRKLKEENQRLSEKRSIPSEKVHKRSKRFVIVQSDGYFPLFRLWFAGMRTAARSPRLPSARQSHGSVIAAAFNTVVLRPLAYLFAILYYLHLCLLVFPWTLFLTALISGPLLVFILLRSIRFSDAPAVKPLFYKTDAIDYLWLLVCIPGFLVPLFIPGYDAYRD